VGKILSSVQSGGYTLKPHDSVAVESPAGSLEYLGKILKIVQEPGGAIQVQLQWYYRPDEARGGRQFFHGEREIFESDHVDWTLLESVNGVIYVHTLEEYNNLETLRINDFFSRFVYKAAGCLFQPERVPTLCICAMPYNPDLVMIECSKCREWFHPRCVQMEGEDMSITNWTCFTCKQ